MGYNILPSSSSANQNSALIIDHLLDFTNIWEPDTGYSVPKVVITVKVSWGFPKRYFPQEKTRPAFFKDFFLDTAIKSRNDTFGVQVYALLILMLSTRRIFPPTRNYWFYRKCNWRTEMSHCEPPFKDKLKILLKSLLGEAEKIKKYKWKSHLKRKNLEERACSQSGNHFLK